MANKKKQEEAVKEAIDRARAEASEAEEQETAAQTEADPAEEQGTKEECSCETEEAEDAKSSGKKDKKSRKEKRDKKDEQIADLTDKLKRSMAEFDNFRKRTEKEKSRMYEIGAGDVIGKVLAVVDNFERGLAQISEEQKEDPLATGMEAIFKQLTGVLDELGVKPIEAVGQQFDPDFHNAVMHVEDEEAGENTVVEEFQKGYTYRDSVIRHSMVKVAN